MVVLQRTVKYSWHTWAQPSVIFLFLHSLNNCREVHAILNALCNSQDILLFFLLSTTSSLWAVICSQAAELLLISFLPHRSPCLSELLSLSYFLFEDMCPVWWGIVNWKMREMLLNCLLKNLIHCSILRVWILIIPDIVSKLIYLPLLTSEVYTPLWIKTRLGQNCNSVVSGMSSSDVCT